MNQKHILTIIALTALILILFPAEAGYSQEQPTLDIPDTANDAMAVITPLMGYQGRLAEGGAPVTGDRVMTFSLWTAAPSGGTKIWEEGPKLIAVTNGLFYTALGEYIPFNATVLSNMDQNLWLEVVVGGITLPRQRLMGAPYALSLAPGTNIEGNPGADQSVLKAQSTGNSYGLQGLSDTSYGVVAVSNDSHGLVASSFFGVGLDGAALHARAGATNGVAVWALSDSTDTTLVASNDGSGPLIKGFGGDGGDHEFVVRNDGTVQQARNASGLAKAATLVWCNSVDSYIFKSFNNVAGTITITNGSAAGRCVIDFGFKVDDRFIIATSDSVLARGASCIPLAGFPDKIDCLSWSASGSGVGSAIYVVVF